MATIDDIGGDQPLNAPPLGGPTGWAAAVRDYLKGHDSAIVNSVPTGTIWMYAGTTAPNGWHLCNGTAHGSTALAALIGANTPNLQGKFALGAGPSNPLLSTAGSWTHSHSAGGLYALLYTTAANLYQKRSAATPSWSASHIVTGASGGTSAVAQTIGTEIDGATSSDSTAPPYVAVNYIIKK